MTARTFHCVNGTCLDGTLQAIENCETRRTRGVTMLFASPAAARRYTNYFHANALNCWRVVPLAIATPSLGDTLP